MPDSQDTTDVLMETGCPVENYYMLSAYMLQVILSLSLKSISSGQVKFLSHCFELFIFVGSS